MVNHSIETESFSNTGLFPRRRFHVAGKTVDTPAKAIPVKFRREGEAELREESRGVNEIYCTIDGQKLRAERRGNSDAIRSKLDRAVNKAKDDEVNVVILAFEETRALSRVEIEFILDLLSTYSDLLVTPLQYKLARAVESDEDETPYSEYEKGVKTFINAARELKPEMPIMATLSPRLSWENIRDLMGVYERNQVKAYCLNMDRLKITSQRQVSVIEPLMRNIARRSIEEEVLFYAINMDPGQSDENMGIKPAADLAALGLGIDIIGECHVSPRMPEEVREAMEQEQEEAVTFEFFDREEFAYREVLLADLPKELPESSSFDAEYVVKQGAQSEQSRRRLQKIINAELMGLTASALHSEIESNSAYNHISSKRGVPPRTAEALQTVRQGFDDERSQSGLGDFV